MKKINWDAWDHYNWLKKLGLEETAGIIHFPFHGSHWVSLRGDKLE